mmetsp:Transcript_9503/g.38781  ORF Transcript_9503/g.38781 Transcript_9503/m.38781 type:complete len:221 (+) Transcript_9503:171-833(+)
MTHAAFAAVTADAFVGMILRLSALLTNAHASSCVTLRRTLSTKASRRSIECRRFIDSLNCRYLHDITRRLPSDLDPNVAAEYLFDEFYWETRCSVLYPRQALLAEQHGLSWKQLFFEIHMQQHFEAFGGNDHVSFIVSLLCGGLLVRSGYAARDFDDFECVPRLHIHASCRTAAWTPRFISIAAEVAQHHDCQFDLWSQKSRDELRPDALWNEGKLSCLL